MKKGEKGMNKNQQKEKQNQLNRFPRNPMEFLELWLRLGRMNRAIRCGLTRRSFSYVIFSYPVFNARLLISTLLVFSLSTQLQALFPLQLQTMFPPQLQAQELTKSKTSYFLEAGVFATDFFLVSSGTRPFATVGWHSDLFPTIRFEWWQNFPLKPGAAKNAQQFQQSRQAQQSQQWGKGNWRLGVVLQPFRVSYQQRFTADLRINGIEFQQGEMANVALEFHNFRMTASFLAKQWKGSEFRMGLSGIIRYAYLGYKSPSGATNEDGYLTVPLIHYYLEQRILSHSSFIFAGDFLLSPTGIGGLYDIFIGFGYKTWSFGYRAFGGGFNPKREDRANSNILYNSLVFRKRF